VLFEAPHRIVRTLEQLAESFGPERQAVIARELTKMHETIYRGTLSELAQRADQDKDLVRGEITLVVAGAAAATEGDPQLLARALPLLLKDLAPARAAAIAAQLSGVPRARAYELALQLARKKGAEAD
jgi:16S rRNA (cytidine1402-2'-O)-methyltransferase